jgi:ABC-type polysaccharide/polyol phosphate transport system ATPase subunit
MVDAERTSAAEAIADESYSVVVEGLGRRYATSRSAYAPPTTIWSRLLGGGAAGGDDDDDDDVEELPEPEPEEELERWALRDVTFALRPGEALAVVGGKGSGAEVLMRVLSSMLPPTAGRAALVGRVTPTIELATALTRIDASSKYHARLLATAAHVPRGSRSQWIEEVSAFARVDETGQPAKADAATIARRMAVAAAVDPTADVLLVDDMPALGDPTFRARCLARLGAALDRGATAVVAGPEPSPMLEFCREAILMTDGRIERWGSPADLIVAHRRRSRRNPYGQTRDRREDMLAGFNEYAAILGVRGSDAEEPGTTLVRVELETAYHDAEIAVSLLLRPLDAPEENPVVLQQAPAAPFPDPGRYVVTAALSADAGEVVPATLEVVANVHSRGLQTEIGRRDAARLWPDASQPPVEDATQMPEASDASHPFTDLQAVWEIEWVREPD